MNVKLLFAVGALVCAAMSFVWPVLLPVGVILVAVAVIVG